MGWSRNRHKVEVQTVSAPKGGRFQESLLGWRPWRGALRSPGRLLAGLLIADLLFVLMHVLHKQALPAFADISFMVTLEGGYGERFQYLKEVSIAVMLGFLASRHRSALFAAWALVFFYLLLDDSLSVHERLGSWLAGVLGFQAALGLRAVDFGELLVSGVVAGGFVLLIATLALRSTARMRRLCVDYLQLLALLVFFGVVVDMLHVIGKDYGLRGLGLLEDGGEMLAMSLITAYTFWQCRREQAFLKRRQGA